MENLIQPHEFGDHYVYYDIHLLYIIYDKNDSSGMKIVYSPLRSDDEIIRHHLKDRAKDTLFHPDYGYLSRLDGLMTMFDAFRREIQHDTIPLFGVGYTHVPRREAYGCVITKIPIDELISYLLVIYMKTIQSHLPILL
jgi:hypothetical protein